MNVSLSDTQAQMLRAQLALRIGELEKEAAHTEQHDLQRALAADVDALKEILGRVDAALQPSR